MAWQMASGQKIISDAQLEIEVENGKFQNVFAQALLLADRYGGYLVSSNSYASGDDGTMKTGTVAIRVPSSRVHPGLGRRRQAGYSQEPDALHPGRHRGVRRPPGAHQELRGPRELPRGLARQGQDRRRDPAGAVGAHLRPAGIWSSSRARLRYLDEHTSYSTITMSIFEKGTEPVVAQQLGRRGRLQGRAALPGAGVQRHRPRTRGDHPGADRSCHHRPTSSTVSWWPWCVATGRSSRWAISRIQQGWHSTPAGTVQQPGGVARDARPRPRFKRGAAAFDSDRGH